MKNGKYKIVKNRLKSLSFIILTIMLILTSCEQNECDTLMSQVQIENWTHDPYQFLINDSFHSTIQGRDSLLVVLESGYYNFKLIQESGFDSIPNTKEAKSFAMDACTFTWWTIHD